MTLSKILSISFTSLFVSMSSLVAPNVFAQTEAAGGAAALSGSGVTATVAQ